MYFYDMTCWPGSYVPPPPVFYGYNMLEHEVETLRRKASAGL